MRIEPAGTEAGGAVTRYRMRGDLDLDLWYDDRDRLRRIAFDYKGSRFDYVEGARGGGGPGTPGRRPLTAADGEGSGRLVWITGASSGIGAALAQAMAAAGWRVAASARGADALAGLAAAVPAIRPYPLDIADGAACEAAVARIEAELGPIDVAVLNAGTHLPMGRPTSMPSASPPWSR